jgi:thiamine-monophosphate kinase
MAVNLSDIAAMGGWPLYALVSLGLPADLQVSDYEALFEGMRDELQEYQSLIIGGNLAQTEKKLIVDITLIGEVHPNQFLERKGARVDDRIYVTGEVGASAAGFQILQKFGSGYPQKFKTLVEKHRQPQPRIRVGQELAKRNLATAMIDLSDGIASDLYHICQMNQVGAELLTENLPVPEQLQQISDLCQISKHHLALHSGEDYELLFTVDKKVSEETIKALGAECAVPMTCIGRILSNNQEFSILDKEGNRIPLQPSGWDHFKASNE